MHMIMTGAAHQKYYLIAKPALCSILFDANHSIKYAACRHNRLNPIAKAMPL